MIHSDDVIRLLVETGLNRKPAIPDTPELAALRAQLIKEEADIKAKGGTVLIPNE
jgi:hypothetical protein